MDRGGGVENSLVLLPTDEKRREILSGMLRMKIAFSTVTILNSRWGGFPLISTPVYASLYVRVTLNESTILWASALL